MDLLSGSLFILGLILGSVLTSVYYRTRYRFPAAGSAGHSSERRSLQLKIMELLRVNGEVDINGLSHLLNLPPTDISSSLRELESTGQIISLSSSGQPHRYRLK